MAVATCHPPVSWPFGFCESVKTPESGGREKTPAIHAGTRGYCNKIIGPEWTLLLGRKMFPRNDLRLFGNRWKEA